MTTSVESKKMAGPRPIYPLTAPGLSYPGTDFIKMAAALGSSSEIKGKGAKQQFIDDGAVERMVRDAVYSDGSFRFNLTVKGSRTVTTDVFSGHMWGDQPGEEEFGPRPADVMVISKVMGPEEITNGRNMCGPAGGLLMNALQKQGVRPVKWYVTNLLKCAHPNEGDGWQASWVKQFLPLLQQELRLVKPKYILCLGADVAKAMMGKNFVLSKMEGRAIDYPIPLRKTHEDDTPDHIAKLMVCTHPSAVIRSPELLDRFENSVKGFVDMTKGIDRNIERGIDHRIIREEDELEALVTEVLEEPDSYQKHLLKGQPKTALIAVDAEWHGEHPQNDGSYVRTIQISWAPKKAACIVLTEPGGKELHENWIKCCVEKLNEILKSTDDRLVRPCMHFGTADLEWLVPLGIDLRSEYQAPTDWKKCKFLGGFDTGMAAHSYEETSDMSLKSQSMMYTEAPVYAAELDEWKTEYVAEHGIKLKDLEGYGECPIEVLGPYGNYDADVTRRLALMYMEKLDADRYGNNCWESFWTSQRILLPILEMHQTGIVFDRARADDLTETYVRTRDRLRKKIRDWANWPELNLESPFQVREFLFGEEYNGKEFVNGKPVRLRPEKAKTLGLKPILSTGKRAKEWDEIELNEEEDENTASTGRAVLAILARSAIAEEVDEKGEVHEVNYKEQTNWLRDYRFISQILKGFLREPVKDKKTNEVLRDESGKVVYNGGFFRYVCDDERIRCRLYPTKETYRWSATSPNAQAISKRREDDYKKIIGDDYTYPIRSVFKAPPGYAIVESDYIGAELFAMAMLADDKNMIDHCLRNQLPESDPNHYEIHSSIAVRAFRLDCPPTKQGLADIGKSSLRIAAKGTVFGTAYGRGPKALAVSLREEGVNVTEDEARALGDTLFEMYPGLPDMFEACRKAAVNDHCICGVGGQWRRFPIVDVNDRKLVGDIERQGMNFRMQNMIAWAADRALDNLYSRRRKYQPCDYRMVLQVHDALVFLVKGEHVAKFVTEVLPECMVQMVPIVPRNLNGTPIPNAKTYRLGIDTEVYVNWGDVPKPEELLEIGCSPKFAHWEPAPGVEDGWIHGKYKSKETKKNLIWKSGKWWGETK